LPKITVVKNINNLGKEFDAHPYNEAGLVIETKPIKKLKVKKAGKKKGGSPSPKRELIEVGPHMMMDHVIRVAGGGGRRSPTAAQY
jgi:hypothetical protein